MRVNSRSALVLVVALLGLLGAFALFRSRRPAPAPVTQVPIRAPAPATTTPGAASRLAGLAATIGPDAISPLAEGLNAPTGTIQRDLEILNQVFEAWQTNFPREGNPVGENEEITRALAGDNPLHFAFVSPRHPAIDRAGRLCDRWGTPFRFHQLSGTVMELRSAGPDRVFATPDDGQFAPGGNTP